MIQTSMSGSVKHMSATVTIVQWLESRPLIQYISLWANNIWLYIWVEYMYILNIWALSLYWVAIYWHFIAVQNGWDEPIKQIIIKGVDIDHNWRSHMSDNLIQTQITQSNGKQTIDWKPTTSDVCGHFDIQFNKEIWKPSTHWSASHTSTQLLNNN